MKSSFFFSGAIAIALGSSAALAAQPALEQLAFRAIYR
jgi:hypothetical protein